MSLLSSAALGRCLAATLLLGAVITCPQLSTAGIVTFTVPTITLNQSNSVQTGFFDVLVAESGGSDLLNGWQVDLLLSSNTNIKFIAADLNTTPTALNAAPYVYAGNSANPTPFLALDGSEVANSDVPNTNNVSLSSSSFALVRIEYSIAANFIGVVAMNLNQDSPNTDGNADFVQLGTDLVDEFSPTAVSGAIKVVPEPSAAVLALLGVFGQMVISYRRMRRTASRSLPKARFIYV